MTLQGEVRYVLVMGRIRGRTRAQTRGDSLSAAAALFAERGFDGASLGAIAGRAGISAAALCHHFGSKQGLYDAAIDHVYESLSTLASSLDPKSSFEAIVEQVYAHAEEHRDGIRLLLLAIMSRGSVDARVRDRHMAPLTQLVASQIADRFEVDLIHARQSLVVLSHLVARFVSNHPDDNAIAFDEHDPQALRRAILDVLISTGRHLLERPLPSPTSKSQAS